MILELVTYKNLFVARKRKGRNEPQGKNRKRWRKGVTEKKK